MNMSNSTEGWRESLFDPVLLLGSEEGGASDLKEQKVEDEEEERKDKILGDTSFIQKASLETFKDGSDGLARHSKDR
jgi:hypothetical protein